MKKIEKIQYRALQFLHNDSDFDYNTLLNKSGKCSMEVRRLRTMALEIFKSLNDRNPSFRKILFIKKKQYKQKKNGLIIHTRNTVTIRSNSLRRLGQNIWNTLPENIKEITKKFKESIKKQLVWI